MNSTALSIVCLILVATGVLLVFVGGYITLKDHARKQLDSKPETEADSLEGNITALTKLLEALKDYPAGQRLIVLGILLVIIGGGFGGVDGLLAVINS